MKKTTSLLLAAMVAGSVFTTSAMADAKKGQKYYLKKLKVCKKDGLKNGAVFATKHSRQEWASIKESGKLQDEWKSICSHGVKKINKMKEKDINNLYDFVWKYASDGEVPSCG
ncbi:cytochrome C [Sulfurimonas sp. SAG-AH-194-L11]|nr:cytochrome C [Sulfurimonas sp. SAG-AH-194-L11]MDF1877328.1 cytochrome C [Sulfurimonas sp. SAG-AH-194-L11]